MQHRLAYIGTNTPHRLLYNTGAATDNEQHNTVNPGHPYISRPQVASASHASSRHPSRQSRTPVHGEPPTATKEHKTDSTADAIKDGDESRAQMRLDDYSADTKQARGIRNIQARQDSVRSGFNVSGDYGRPVELVSDKELDQLSVVAGELRLIESPYRAEQAKTAGA